MPLGSLFQGSVTLEVKQFFLVFRRNILCFNSFCLSAGPPTHLQPHSLL